MTTAWVEVRLVIGADIAAFYESVGGQPDGSHHFWDEPWWPGGWVVRVPGGDVDAWRVPSSHVDHVIVWDASRDERLFGAGWPAVQRLLSAASALTPGVLRLERESQEQFLSKLIHCLCNAQGFSYVDEAELFARMAERMREVSEGASCLSARGSVA